MKNWFKKSDRLLAGTILAGASMMGMVGPALAQDAPAADEEIIVTGSRIPQPNLQSVSPVQVVGEEEFRLQGVTDVVDLLNTLPQISQNNAIGFSNTTNPLSTPGGLTTADLRGLGQQRTLVLVNGRRLGIGDPNTGNPNPSPDLNQIPATLIERVDVVTGGASATYGSDAVAGVLNFIMRDNFEGVQIDAQYGFAMAKNDNDFAIGLLEQARNVAAGSNAVPEEDVTDGENGSVTVTIGASAPDGRGNVTGYVSWRQADPVIQRDRDFSACQINVGGDPANAACAGSVNANIFIPGGLAGNDAFSVVGNMFEPYPVATSTPPPLFNSNEFSFLSRGDERYTAGFFANYEFNEHLRAYSEFNFMDDRTTVQIAPSALFLGSALTSDGEYRVNCANPLLSGQQAATLGCSADDITNDVLKIVAIGRRNVEGGGRQSFYQHQNYRAVVGFDGNLTEGWSYDVYGSYYYTTLFQSNRNYLSLTRINRGLDVVDADPGSGVNPQCRSALDGTDPTCLPYNIWSEGGVDAAQVAYLNSLGTAQGSTSERIVAGSIVGDLGTSMGLASPWASDGLQFALGVEYRSDTFDFDPDAAELSGDLSGFGGAAAAVHDGFDVMEFYTELLVPIARDKPMIYDLSLEAGYRFSDYNTAAGTVDTYKLGGNYAPTEGLRFRASYQHAIRAPSAVELFTPALQNLTSQVSSDPCSTHVATLAQCLNTIVGSGLTEAQFTNLYNNFLIPDCPSGQCGALLGGNVNLTPEEADTVSVGFTVTPSMIPGFTGSVDWYRIELNNIIGALGANLIMSQCLDTNDPLFCGLIQRNTAGAIFGLNGFINLTGTNAGFASVEGVDVQANYRLGIGDMGSLAFTLNGAYLSKAEVQQNPAVPQYDCAGLFGAVCATVNPEWRHNLRVSWDTPWNLLLSANWRHIGEASLDTNSHQPGLEPFTDDVFSAKLEAKNYLDLSGIWDLNENFTFRAGVNNVTDEDPQIIDNLITGTGTPNAYPTYDLLGRVFFFGITAKY